METLEQLKEKMECNGYAFFNQEAFNNKSNEICYIPENAESLDDCFSYLDLRGEVEKWAKDNEDYLIEYETDIETVLNIMYEDIIWTFPSTYLDQLTY